MVYFNKNSPFLYLIDLYQVYISPLKGYKCAYGVSGGRHTCSSYGKKVFSKFPPLLAAKLLKRQFLRCQNRAIILNSSDGYEGRIVYDVCGIPVCSGKDHTGGRGCG